MVAGLARRVVASAEAEAKVGHKGRATIVNGTPTGNMVLGVEVRLRRGRYVAVHPVGGHVSGAHTEDVAQDGTARLTLGVPDAAGPEGEQVDEAVAVKPSPGAATWRPTEDHDGVVPAGIPSPREADTTATGADADIRALTAKTHPKRTGIGWLVSAREIHQT